MFKLSRIRHRIVRNASYSKNRQEWIPLGRTSKSLSQYELGQHFIHNQLNYRGLILVPIPHEKYVYDSTKKDYNISVEVRIKKCFAIRILNNYLAYISCFGGPEGC